MVHFYGKNVLKGLKFIRVCAQYGDNALLWRSMYTWIDMFKEGGTSITASECLGHPPTVRSARYSDMLWTEASHLHKMSKVIAHNNAWPHATIHTRETLLNYPAYSSDPAPLDFHLLGPLKRGFEGHGFTDDKVSHSAITVLFWCHWKACGLSDKVRSDAGRL
jgi:hypothetical protein